MKPSGLFLHICIRTVGLQTDAQNSQTGASNWHIARPRPCFGCIMHAFRRICGLQTATYQLRFWQPCCNVFIKHVQSVWRTEVAGDRRLGQSWPGRSDTSCWVFTRSIKHALRACKVQNLYSGRSFRAHHVNSVTLAQLTYSVLYCKLAQEMLAIVALLFIPWRRGCTRIINKTKDS